MIILISALIIILHPEEMKKAVKQTKLDDYFQKKIKCIDFKYYLIKY